MNIPLIQSNLKKVEDQAMHKNTTDAVGTAMAVVKLLLQDPIQADARSVYRAYGGMAKELRDCFETLKKNYKSGEDMKEMQEKINGVNKQIADYTKDAETIEATNRELLDAEETLRTRKQELEDLQKKVTELIRIRDQELKDLRAEVDKKKADLEKLEESCRQAQAEREKWLQVFDVNNRLIADLPDSVADRTAEALIAQAKAFRDQAQTNAEQSEAYLLRVIEALEGDKQKMGEAN